MIMQLVPPPSGPRNHRGPKLHYRAVSVDWARSLRDRRIQLGLTQRTLADLAGVAERTVIAAERGADGVAVGNVVKIADVLGLTLHLEAARSVQPRG